jgi:hypothetical protein
MKVISRKGWTLVPVNTCSLKEKWLDIAACKCHLPVLILQWGVTRVGNFRQKNYSSEDRIDGTIGLFQRNSGCFVEQKTLEIPFRTIPQRRMLGTKLEANSWNSILNHSAEQKLSDFRSKLFRRGGKCSEFRSVEKKQTLGIPFRSMSRTKTCCPFCMLEQDYL